jgi:hypothetical protein
MVLQVSGEPDRCSCGWDAASARKKAKTLFFTGLVTDITGSLGVIYGILVDRSFLYAAVGILAAGSVLLALGAVGMARTGILRINLPASDD